MKFNPKVQPFGLSRISKNKFFSFQFFSGSFEEKIPINQIEGFFFRSWPMGILRKLSLFVNFGHDWFFEGGPDSLFSSAYKFTKKLPVIQSFIKQTFVEIRKKKFPFFGRFQSPQGPKNWTENFPFLRVLISQKVKLQEGPSKTP